MECTLVRVFYLNGRRVTFKHTTEVVQVFTVKSIGQSGSDTSNLQSERSESEK